MAFSQELHSIHRPASRLLQWTDVDVCYLGVSAARARLLVLPCKIRQCGLVFDLYLCVLFHRHQ